MSDNQTYLLPTDEELLEMFPYEPSGEYIVNIAQHGNPDVFYDEAAELDSHLNDITSYIQYIVDEKKVSLSEALDIARKERDYPNLYDTDPKDWDHDKIPWYVKESEDYKSLVSCPGPCQKLTYTSPPIDLVPIDSRPVDLRQSSLPTPSLTLPPSIILVDDNGNPLVTPGEAKATIPSNNPQSALIMDNPHKFRDRYEATESEEVKRLSAIAGVAHNPSGLTPEQKATFGDTWVQEEAKQFLDSRDIQTRKYFLQNRRIMLTYKTHINKDSLREFIRGVCNNPNAVVDIAHETGDPVCPYPHTHAVVDFVKKFQSQSCRILDYQGIHPHILPITNEKSYDRARHYLSKEDPECSYLFNPDIATTLVSRVWACPTLQDALRQNVHNPSDVSGVMQLFSLKSSNPSSIKYKSPDLPWQKDFLAKFTNPIQTEHDERSIVWIYDDLGSSGKSQMCRYFLATQPNSWYVVTGCPTSRDFATVLSSAISSGWNGHGLIFDIPRRESEDDLASDGHGPFKHLYHALEIAKNGIFTSVKYQGSTNIFNQGWVVVFSNGLPNIRSMSIDRWDIYEMSSDKSMSLITPQVAERKKNDIRDSLFPQPKYTSYSTNSGIMPV